jgi:hypothetical protein
MKQKTPGLSLEPFDQETFQRVWRRVMPDQDLSPVQPAAPTFSPESPETPETPTPPASPCPPQTSPPACLCPDSESYAPCLEQLMEETCVLSQTYQTAARRCGGRTARLLSSLLPSLGQDQRRLCAAYFLITGERYTPAAQAVPLSGAAPWQLRSLFMLEQQRAAKLSDLATGTSGDPCLRELFRELEHTARLRAGRIRALLEQM